MNTVANAPTYTVGYYNPNRWPIQIEVSSRNIRLHLQPNQFILDKSGRKINDPLFDAYTKTKHLAKEESPTPVQLVLIPETKANQPVTQIGHAVAAGNRFVDNNGVRTPDMTSVPRIQAPVSNSGEKPSTLSMTMDEARKLGFAAKTRPVPEDYGVTDTAGMPPSNVPPIRYAIDGSAGPKAAPLPQEATQIDNRAAPGSVPIRSGLISSLKRSVVENKSHATETGFISAASSQLTPAQRAAIESGTVLNDDDLEGLAAPDIDMLPDDNVEALVPSNIIGLDTEVRPAPAPVAAPRPIRASAPVATVEQIGGPDEPPVEPVDTSIVPSTEPSGEESGTHDEAGKPFVCAADGKSFRYRSMLETYVKRKYPDRQEELMKPYPKTT